MSDDAQLLLQYVQLAQVAAFERLIGRHEAVLLGLASALLGDEHAAQDLVQESFMRLARHADGLQRQELRGGSLRPWLCRVTRNLAIDRLRREGRWRPVGDGRQLSTAVGRDAGAAAADPTAQPVAEADLADLLWRCVAELSPLQRAAVLLRYRDGRSYQEIAEALDKSINHIGVLLNRALARLRENHSLRLEVLA